MEDWNLVSRRRTKARKSAPTTLLEETWADETKADSCFELENAWQEDDFIDTRGFAMRAGHRDRVVHSQAKHVRAEPVLPGRSSFKRRAGGYRDVVRCGMCKPGRYKRAGGAKSLKKASPGSHARQSWLDLLEEVRRTDFRAERLDGSEFDTRLFYQMRLDDITENHYTYNRYGSLSVKYVHTYNRYQRAQIAKEERRDALQAALLASTRTAMIKSKDESQVSKVCPHLQASQEASQEAFAAPPTPPKAFFAKCRCRGCPQRKRRWRDGMVRDSTPRDKDLEDYEIILAGLPVDDEWQVMAEEEWALL